MKGTAGRRLQGPQMAPPQKAPQRRLLGRHPGVNFEEAAVAPPTSSG